MLAKPKRYLWTEMFMKNIRHQCQSCPLPPPSPPPDQLFSLPKSSRGATTTTPLSHIIPFFFGYGQPIVGEMRAISVALAFHDDLTI